MPKSGRCALAYLSLSHKAVRTARQLGLEELITPFPAGPGDRMAAAQVIAPDSKLASPAGCARRPRPAPWARSSARAAVMRMTCMRRWTGSPPGKTGSRTRSRRGTWPAAPWFSTTCPRPRSRGGPARWVPSAIPKTGSAAGCRSSTGCSPPRTASRSPSRCSRATPATPRRSPARWARSRTGSGSAGWCSWATGACSPQQGCARTSALRAWTGSPRCAPRRSRRWSATGAPALTVRPGGPGRDHPPGLPRRAAGRLQEPVPGSRAGPQA